jgi:hypothetical protein
MNSNTNTNSSNTNNTNNENVLPKIKSSFEFNAAIVLLFFLIIVLFLIYFKVNLFGKPPKSNEETVANIFIILFFTLIIVVVCIALLPNFKDIKKLFEQISSVTYFIVYTIGLILFFRSVPSNIINDYAYIFAPLLIILGAFLFYKSSAYSYIDQINVNYERIKSMILFFCLITTFIIYYNNDPGGYISKYFGYSFLLTIIISVFAFLYLLTVLTLPDNVKTPEKGANFINFLDNFSNFSSYGSIAFLIFIVVVTIMITTYDGGNFFKDKDFSASFLVIVLLICILWSILLGVNLFPEFTDNTQAFNSMNFFKRSLLTLFSFVISGLIIFWIVYNINIFSGNSSVTSLLLNLFIVMLVLGLVYNTINVKIPVGNSKKNAFFNLIVNTIFYIPCLFSNFFNLMGSFFIGKYSKESKESSGSILMLLAIIILIILYFVSPSIFNTINLQGGKQLVNQPVYTDTEYALGTYEELNESEKFDYQFAISSWIYIDSDPPNTNASYNKFTSILNFGNKPNILYNGKTNTLMITMEQKDLNKEKSAKLIDFDENGNRILYTNNNFLLQKWNNIIINYSGGVLDIFLNGELVKSNIGVIPYYKLDNLTIGENDGIKGGICNVVYFRHPLNSSNIYYLYKMVKNRTPPIISDSNKSIIP